MEHSLHFGSPRRWLVLWTGSSDPIEKKHLKVVFHNLGACDVQTDRKMEKGEQFYSIEQTAAPSKQMLNISYSFMCKHSNLQEKIFPKGIGWPFQVEPFRKEGKKMQYTQMPSVSDICGRRKRKSVICVCLRPCLSSGWVWYVFLLRIFHFKSFGVVSNFHFGSVSSFTKFTYSQCCQAKCVQWSSNLSH